jgi:hypothetical protein
MWVTKSHTHTQQQTKLQFCISWWLFNSKLKSPQNFPSHIEGLIYWHISVIIIFESQRVTEGHL